MQGNAGGEILQCRPPRLLKVSWLFGPDAKEGTSEVEVRLTPGPDGDTEFELTHAAIVDETSSRRTDPAPPASVGTWAC